MKEEGLMNAYNLIQEKMKKIEYAKSDKLKKKNHC